MFEGLGRTVGDRPGRGLPGARRHWSPPLPSWSAPQWGSRPPGRHDCPPCWSWSGGWCHRSRRHW